MDTCLAEDRRSSLSFKSTSMQRYFKQLSGGHSNHKRSCLVSSSFYGSSNEGEQETCLLRAHSALDETLLSSYFFPELKETEEQSISGFALQSSGLVRSQSYPVEGFNSVKLNCFIKVPLSLAEGGICKVSNKELISGKDGCLASSQSDTSLIQCASPMTVNLTGHQHNVIKEDNQQQVINQGKQRDAINQGRQQDVIMQDTQQISSVAQPTYDSLSHVKSRVNKQEKPMVFTDVINQDRQQDVIMQDKPHISSVVQPTSDPLAHAKSPMNKQEVPLACRDVINQDRQQDVIMQDKQHISSVAQPTFDSVSLAKSPVNKEEMSPALKDVMNRDRQQDVIMQDKPHISRVAQPTSDFLSQAKSSVSKQEVPPASTNSSASTPQCATSHAKFPVNKQEVPLVSAAQPTSGSLSHAKFSVNKQEVPPAFRDVIKQDRARDVIMQDKPHILRVAQPISDSLSHVKTPVTKQELPAAFTKSSASNLQCATSHTKFPVDKQEVPLVGAAEPTYDSLSHAKFPVNKQEVPLAFRDVINQDRPQDLNMQDKPHISSVAQPIADSLSHDKSPVIKQEVPPAFTKGSVSNSQCATSQAKSSVNDQEVPPVSAKSSVRNSQCSSSQVGTEIPRAVAVNAVPKEGPKSPVNKQEVPPVSAKSAVSNSQRAISQGGTEIPHAIAVDAAQKEGPSMGIKMNSQLVHCAAAQQCPFGSKVLACGRRREMEDTATVVPSFASLPCGMLGMCSCTNNAALNPTSELHFFGIYDGHGGSQASAYCKERLHILLAEELKLLNVRENSYVNSGEGWTGKWKKTFTDCFSKIDREVGGVCPNGLCGADGVGSSCSCCDGSIAPENVGTTAVVAVLGNRQIVVANCGDSRAVLSRGGQAMALSRDHKPENEDETNRIEAAGGRIICWDGYRVGGFLALSRAIGDRFLKQFIISEPEVTCVQREDADELLILASDGLWDVLSNDYACEVARKALLATRKKRENRTFSRGEDPAATTVAALLVKLALNKGSKDNISVVVVDLKDE